MANTGTLKIIKGADKEFTVRITREDTEEPLDLTGLQEARCLFIKDDGTALIKTSVSGGDVSVVSPASSGKIKFILSDVDTALIKKGEELSFEVEVTIADITSIIQFSGLLFVYEREVPLG